MFNSFYVQGPVLDVSEVNIGALLQRIICTSKRKAAHFSLLKVFLCFLFFLIEQLKIIFSRVSITS